MAVRLDSPNIEILKKSSLKTLQVNTMSALERLGALEILIRSRMLYISLTQILENTEVQKN